uniref:BTB domain-containing protein n=1 Tax=Globodera pallida TaxID=36090 RepID=A0A183CMJ9_GLOPA
MSKESVVRACGPEDAEIVSVDGERAGEPGMMEERESAMGIGRACGPEENKVVEIGVGDGEEIVGKGKEARDRLEEMEVDNEFDNGGFDGAGASRHTYLQERVDRQDKERPSCRKPLVKGEIDGAAVCGKQIIGLRAKGNFGIVDQGPSGDEQVSDTAPRWYMVAQVAGKGVIAARVEMAEQWPDLIWVDNDSVRSSRPLEMGDGVQVAKVEWANTETGWAGPGDWLIPSNKRLNHQAVAKEVRACSQGPVHSALGLVLHVERDKQRRGGKPADMHVKSANIAAPQLPMVMRIQRRHMAPGMESTLRFHGLVQLKLATVIRPQSILVSPHYILPVGFPMKSGDEMLAHEPNLIVRVEPELQKYGYPFDKTFSWKEVELGEKVMACALAAQRAYIQQEQNRFTLVVEILGVEELQENQVSLRFRHQLRNLQELMDMTEVWEEDTAISCRADQDDATKPCATGYVIRLEKRPAAIGYEVTAEVILGFQAAKGQNTWPQFEFLRDGALEAVELRPMISTRALRDRAEMLTGNVCSQRAQKGNESVGKIMSVLLGQEVVRDTPAQAGGVSLTGHKALTMLRGGQKDSAKLMLDNEPRVVFQQAGPGTGKTFTAAAIMAAILKEDASARVLALAPPNIAVVKLVMEMEGVMSVEGQSTPMLALFSGAGKIRYANEVRHIATHTLAAAVDSEEFQKQLEVQDKRIVKRYLSACDRNPRLAQEATVAQLVKEYEERRVCFATLAFAEQNPNLFRGVTHLVLDEAGQAPFSQVLSMAGQHDGLRKLLITGDRRQLRVHLPSLPYTIREKLGLDTVIENMDAAADVDVTTLSVSYRSHPSIVRCVEAAFYRPHKEVLSPGRAPEERAMLTGQTSFKLPVSNCPLVLIHQVDDAVQDEVSRSSSNPAQSDTAMRVLFRLRRAVPDNTVIRCICLYTAQALEIGQLVRQEEMNNILVTTADATQGHESALSVVVTTVSRSAVDTATEEPFWAMPDRVDVALSRAGHGQRPAWKRFISSALEETTVVDPEYVNTIRLPNCQHDQRGRLVLAGDGVVRSEDFYMKWRGNNEGSRAEPRAWTATALLPAHKAILMAASDVFEAMFPFDAQNADPSEETKPVEVPDVEVGAFKAMHSFIYADDVSGLNGDNAIAVLYAGHKIFMEFYIFRF